MIKADLYSFEGKKKESINLPKEYELKVNPALLAQAKHVYEDRIHLGLSRVKTRSEVAISTRKIYKQKGTGGARHGAKSAPIFVGGGVAHGPKGIKRELLLSNSQRKVALLGAIIDKVKSSSFVVVDGMEKIAKTKIAQNLIKKIAEDRNWKDKKGVIIAFARENGNVKRAFRNIKGIEQDDFKNLNAYKVLLAKRIIADKKVFEEKNLSKDISAKDEKKAPEKKDIGKQTAKRSVKKTVIGKKAKAVKQIRKSKK